MAHIWQATAAHSRGSGGSVQPQSATGVRYRVNESSPSGGPAKPPSPARPPVALTIAGSDSGGGAGIQADLKTFQAFGIFGASAVTAVTAQNTVGVSSIHYVPAGMVRDQIRAVAADLAPKAVKSGMLASADIVRCVAQSISEHGLESGYVLDPVMVATSGDRLLDHEAERRVVGELLPLARLVTPNISEAAALTGLHVASVPEIIEATRALVDLGASAALITGGHLAGDVSDVYWDGQEERVWSRPRIGQGEYHGTGCTLSAAVAAGLASGLGLIDSVDQAVNYVRRAISSAPALGAGHPPVNHSVAAGPRSAGRGSRQTT